MCKDIPWNRVIVEEFCDIGMLNEDERYIVEARARSVSGAKQCAHLNISEATLQRMWRAIRDKYDRCQPFSELLPPRMKK